MNGRNSSSITATDLVAAALLLLAILLVFFRNALMPGRILSPADGVFLTPFFSESAPSGFDAPANPLLFDQVYQFTPWRHLAWQSIRAGTLPLWNPYSSTGVPFVATMTSAVFYPVNLLLSVLPFELVFVSSAILRLWIAGIFTYALVRGYGLAHVPALVAAVSFMFAGFHIVWLGHPHTNVSIWLPALVLLAEQLLGAHGAPRIIRLTIAAALVVALQYSGGHIETSVDILFGVGLYYLIRWYQTVWHSPGERARKLQRLLLPAIPLFLGSALAAIQLLPFLEWLFLSAEFQRRASAGFTFVDPLFWKHTLSLATLVFPDLFNNPTWSHPYWSFLLNWSNYNELVLYVGVLTFVLALLAIVDRAPPRRPLVTVYLALVVVCLGRALHWPILDWLNQAPGFRLGSPGRLRLLASFGLCILAALGMESLLGAQVAGRRRLQRVWISLCAAIAASGLVILAGANLALPVLRHRIAEYGRRMVAAEYARRSTHSNPLEVYLAQADRMVDGLIAAFAPTNWAMYRPALWALLGLALVVWSRRSGRDRGAVLGMSLLALVTLDLWSFGQGYNPVVAAPQFYPRSSLISRLAREDGLFRTTALRQDLLPDAHMMYGLSDVRGLDFPTRWYDDYLSLIPDRIPWLSYGSIFAAASSPLMRVLNLKYVIGSDADALRRDDGVEIVARAGEVFLAEVAEPQPRAFLVYEVVAVDDDDEAAAVLRSEPEAVGRRIVLSGMEARSAPAVDAKTGPAAGHEVRNLSYGAEAASWRVITDRDAYLFVSDAYYPGWVASVDDAATPLLRANLAFRAVFVPAGDHQVRFRYEPASLRVGMLVSAGSLLVCVGLGIAVTVRSAWDPRRPRR